jgi:hypothetical protein
MLAQPACSEMLLKLESRGVRSRDNSALRQVPNRASATETNGSEARDRIRRSKSSHGSALTCRQLPRLATPYERLIVTAYIKGMVKS